MQQGNSYSKDLTTDSQDETSPISESIPQVNKISSGQLEDARPMAYATDSQDSASLREINITPLNSGYVVRVGCQTVAVETTETLIDNLRDYLENPKMFERQWYARSSRNKLDKK